MAEQTGEHHGAPEHEAGLPRAEREVRQVARKVIESKIAERGADVDNLTTDGDKALSVYKALLGEDPKMGFGGDNKVRLPDLSDVTDDEGNDYTLPSKDTHLVGVYGLNENGLLECSFAGKDGKIILDGTGGRLKVYLPREVVLDAQLLSEKTAINGVLDTEEHAIFNTYADSLPQNDHPTPPGAGVDDLIDKMAEKQGMLRVVDIQAFLDKLPPDEKDNPAVDALMNGMKDDILTNPKAFADVIHATGHDEDTIADRIGATAAEITDAQAKLAALADPDDADAVEKAALEKEIENAEAKQKTFEVAAKILEDTKPPEPPAPKEVDEATTEHVGKVIRTQIEELDKILLGFKEQKVQNGPLEYRTDLTKEELNTLRHTERLKAELALAEQATGILGPLKRMEALSNAQQTYKEELKGHVVPEGIEQTLKDANFLKQVTEAKDELQATLGLSDAEMAELAAEGGWEKAVESGKYEDKEDEIFDKMYGAAEKTDIYQLMTDVKQTTMNIDNAQWKSRLKEFIKKNPGRRIGLLAAILAAIPVVVAGVAAVGAVGLAGAAAGGGRR